MCLCRNSERLRFLFAATRKPATPLVRPLQMRAEGTTHLRALATAEIQPTQPSIRPVPKHRPAQGDASGRGRDFASSPSPRQHVSTQQRRCLRRERELEKASSGTPQPWAQSHTCTSRHLSCVRSRGAEGTTSSKSNASGDRRVRARGCGALELSAPRHTRGAGIPNVTPRLDLTGPDRTMVGNIQKYNIEYQKCNGRDWPRLDPAWT